MTPTRVVHEADAIAWLQENQLANDAAVVTSLPNVDEFQHRDLERWRRWFVETATLILRKTAPESAAVFFQTDIQHDGTWIDKSQLIQQAASSIPIPLIWHKIALRAPPKTTTYSRPGYAHLLCFSASLRNLEHNATPDVLPLLGEMDWPRAMGLEVATTAVRWLRDYAAAKTIVAPFCGTGTALLAANQLGLDGVGIERSKTRAAKARER